MYNSNLDHQHSTNRKFAKRWFSPYEGWQVRDNGTYQLSGTLLRTPVAGKSVKILRKREEAKYYMDLNEAKATKEVGITGVEDPEDNDSGVMKEKASFVHLHSTFGKPWWNWKVGRREDWK